MVAYIAVTCHFVTEKWELISRLLSFRELDGTHSGENQAQHLYDVVTDFGIVNKVRRSHFHRVHRASRAAYAAMKASVPPKPPMYMQRRQPPDA